MQGQFVQIPCGKCGTTVWISPAAGVGYCPSCHTPNNLPPGATQAGPPMGPPGMGAPGFGAPMGGMPPGVAQQAPPGMVGQPAPQFEAPGGGSVLGKVLPALGGGLLMAALGIGWAVFKWKFQPGKVSVTSYGMQADKADPDKMLAAATTLATKWRGDARLMKINVLGLRPDGLVDIKAKNAVIEFYSPTGVKRATAKLREDSIKKFNFVNGDQILYKDKWGATNLWTDPLPALPTPGCSLKTLATTKLKDKGLSGDKTAHVQADGEKKLPSWIVNFEGKTMYFDFNDCHELK